MKFEEELAKLMRSPELAYVLAQHAAQEAVARAMKEQKCSIRELAMRLGVPTWRVERWLREGPMTLRRLAEIAAALGCGVEITLKRGD